MRNRRMLFLLLTAMLAAPLLVAGCGAVPHEPSTIESSQDRWKS